MAEAIFMFSPGGCGRWCPCTRCNDAEGVANATPRRVVVTILGTAYSLWHWQDSNQLENCVWWKIFSTPATIGTCGTPIARLFLTISEDVNGTKYWLLQAEAADNTSVYEWFEPMTSQGACFTSQTLTTNIGTCTADNPISAALSMPDGPRPPCCACTAGGSGSGSGAGGGGTPADNGCCTGFMPSAWDIEIPSSIWDDGTCAACNDIIGTFHCPHVGSSVYRYLNTNWCVESLDPSIPSCEGNPVTLDITVYFTTCKLKVIVTVRANVRPDQPNPNGCSDNVHAQWSNNFPWTGAIDCTAQLSLGFLSAGGSGGSTPYRRICLAPAHAPAEIYATAS